MKDLQQIMEIQDIVELLRTIRTGSPEGVGEKADALDQRKCQAFVEKYFPEVFYLGSMFNRKVQHDFRYYDGKVIQTMYWMGRPKTKSISAKQFLRLLTMFGIQKIGNFDERTTAALAEFGV